MKIALVGPFPHGTEVRGGVEGVIDALARQLASNSKNDVHVLSPSNSDDYIVEHYGSVTVHRLPRARYKLPGFLNYWTIERLYIHRLLAVLKPDIAHFHGNAGWLLGYKGARVLTIHGIAERDILFGNRSAKWLRSWVVRVVENAGRRIARDIILINPYVEQAVGIALRGRRHFIENPIDQIFFDVNKDLSKRQGHLIAVGKVSFLKNTLAVLRVFKKAYEINPDLRLTIAGSLDEKDYAAKCFRYVETNGLSGSVRFVGNLHRADLAKLYRSATAHLLFSNQDTSPMVIAECMASGVPTVGRPICGVPYLIEDGFSGVLIDPDDESNAASVVERVALNTDHVFSANLISKRAYERFHPASVADRTLDVYNIAINSRKEK